MIRSKRYLQLIGLGGLLAVGATACNARLSVDIEGSGVAQTTTYDLESLGGEPFDQVEIGNAFDVEITIAEGPRTVEVTIDDNLVDKLKVEVDDGELKIGMKRSMTSFNVEPTVIISMPALTELDLSGATSAIVTDLDESALDVELSGASVANLTGDLTALDADVSGSSELIMSGTVDELDLEVSSAGSADFTDARTAVATIDLSGSSNAEFDLIDRVVGDISGASNVIVPQGTDVDVKTSGASRVERS